MANFTPYQQPRLSITLLSRNTNGDAVQKKLSKIINFLALVGQDSSVTLTGATILKPDGTTYNSPAEFIDDFARKLNSLTTNTYIDTNYNGLSINEILEE